jgi:hypothetical protein
MFNKQRLSHQQPNDKKLTDLVEEQFEELSDEESAKIQGGFFFYNPYPYLDLNSIYYPSTQTIIDNTESMQAAFDRHNERVLNMLREN